MSDGERHSLGDVVLEFRHTPGHTPESMSIVIWEHAGDDTPYGVLTGDTLFIGDVGRPDLLSSIGCTREELAEQLYDSLRTKLLTLPDATRVYPAHGAGSSCGKNLSTDLWSTIGEQRRTNYAVRAADRDTFIHLVTEGPAAGARLLRIRRDAQPSRRTSCSTKTPRPTPLTYDEMVAAVADGAVLIDGRDPEEFAPAICGVRSTSASPAGTPSSPGRWCSPMSTSC